MRSAKLGRDPHGDVEKRPIIAPMVCRKCRKLQRVKAPVAKIPAVGLKVDDF
jgi:hypothetical protein